MPLQKDFLLKYYIEYIFSNFSFPPNKLPAVDTYSAKRIRPDQKKNFALIYKARVLETSEFYFFEFSSLIGDLFDLHLVTGLIWNVILCSINLASLPTYFNL